MLKALRISPSSYPIYQQAMALLQQPVLELVTINNHFVVIKDGRKRVEYYEEKDFRKDFEWVTKPAKDHKPVYKFLPVNKLKNDEDE